MESHGLTIFKIAIFSSNCWHNKHTSLQSRQIPPLTQNEYTVKDSFEAINMIHKIPPEFFDTFIFDKFNSFHKNLKFTIDCFDDNNIQFLKIATNKNKTNLYYKATYTGQYSDLNSNIP